jgi:hypothetical protein
VCTLTTSCAVACINSMRALVRGHAACRLYVLNVAYKLPAAASARVYMLLQRSNRAQHRALDMTAVLTCQICFDPFIFFLTYAHI